MAKGEAEVEVEDISIYTSSRMAEGHFMLVKPITQIADSSSTSKMLIDMAQENNSTFTGWEEAEELLGWKFLPRLNRPTRLIPSK